MQISLDDKKKFLVDAMLGNLAKKLRLFGFDAKFCLDRGDNDLLKILRSENRILITRDKELAEKSNKQNLQVIYLMTNNEDEQLLQIKKQIQLENFDISVNRTRCTLCNGELCHVEKNEIKNKIPYNVTQKTNDFWKCSSCKKIYWEGTHIKHLQSFVSRLNEKI